MEIKYSHFRTDFFLKIVFKYSLIKLRFLFKMNKLKILQSTIDKLEKQHGKGSIMKLGDKPINKVSSTSSGSITLDSALGIGGYPHGRVIEIYGPESSGKTTLTLHAIAESQKNGGVAAFIDAEHAFDPTYAKNLGVDIKNLLISQPDNGEQALEIADNLIYSTYSKGWEDRKENIKDLKLNHD